MGKACMSSLTRILILRVPFMAQWLTNLRSMRVRSLALLSGLRIQSYRDPWCRSHMRFRSCIAVAVMQASSFSSDSTPCLGTSIYHRCGSKKKKKKKRILTLPQPFLFPSTYAKVRINIGLQFCNCNNSVSGYGTITFVNSFYSVANQLQKSTYILLRYT